MIVEIQTEYHSNSCGKKIKSTNKKKIKQQKGHWNDSPTFNKLWQAQRLNVQNGFNGSFLDLQLSHNLIQCIDFVHLFQASMHNTVIHNPVNDGGCVFPFLRNFVNNL